MIRTFDETVLTIGDTSPDGLLEIRDTSWDYNGTLRVTVRVPFTERDIIGGIPVRRMRALARRALMYPERTRSARATNRHEYQGCTYITFLVSRNER